MTFLLYHSVWLTHLHYSLKWKHGFIIVLPFHCDWIDWQHLGELQDWEGSQLTIEDSIQEIKGIEGLCQVPKISIFLYPNAFFGQVVSKECVQVYATMIEAVRGFTRPI